MKPHEILLHPYVTEKTLNMLQGTPAQNLKDGNRLEFLVRRQATRDQVKKAFEDLFQVKVAKVNTFVRRDGKHAIIKLKPEFSAEEIGMRIGVFCWERTCAPNAAAAGLRRRTVRRATGTPVPSSIRTFAVPGS